MINVRTPFFDSDVLVKTINLLLEILSRRKHWIRDYENPDMYLDRVEYRKDEDEFYCFFEEVKESE